MNAPVRSGQGKERQPINLPGLRLHDEESAAAPDQPMADGGAASGEGHSPSEMPPLGRSWLRRAALRPQVRRRRYLRRWLVAVLVAGVLALPVLGVLLRPVPVGGVLDPLYAAHDYIWLRLVGYGWTLHAPYALVALVPLAVCVAALLSAWLGPLKGRGPQRWALRRLLGSRAGRGLTRKLVRQPRGVFAGHVLSERYWEIWAELREQAGAGGPVAPRAVNAAAGLVLIGLNSAADRWSWDIRGREVLAVADIWARGASGGSLERLKREMQGGEAGGAEGGDLAERLTGLVRRLDAGDALEPVQIAHEAVMVAVLSSSGESEIGRRWFQSLSLARLGPNAETVRAAEALIDFELWALTTERAAAVQRPEAGPLLNKVFGTKAPAPPAEVWAWSGAST